MALTGSWKKSSRCESSTCVEAKTVGDSVAVRNSNNPDIVALFTPEEWDLFVAGVKDGEFDQI